MPNAPTSDALAPARALRDRYRCPEGFLEFRISGGLPAETGRFHFGAGTTCYGRHLSVVQQIGMSSRNVDVLASVKLHGSEVILPFDPDEVIDCLCFERYPTSQLSAIDQLLKDIYYGLRPLTNRWLRKQIQRLRTVNWQQKRFPQWPVDTTVESICENLLLLSLRASGVDRIPFIWFWPDGAHGCVAMTHDVEEEAGRDFCPQLMDIDDSYGIKASFQIVPEGRYAVHKEFLNQLRDRGCEVCVQDLNHDGRLFDERQEFLRRVALINHYGREYGAKGYRSAVLYRKSEWYKDLDFSFDMSFPNVAHLDPQRGGCCTVMPYFIGDILELPLTTIQDYTLFHILNEHSIELWKSQVEMILAKNGLVSFIVHPDYVTESNTQSVYKDLLGMLDELRKREALWFALPSEIDSWWRARNQMSIVKDAESWRIVGDGAERAVLAFAKVVDGKLVYELADTKQRELPEGNSLAGKIPSLLAKER